ncbi:unnamed protein product [Blepharisma stoltei]|uniref:Uncharacterized protein n=1 Tax=Blepharisma stoltei TaxID=1481888 RepID=A0AAU9IGY9_9CILI|nr:unnamed protein product [Blepharisma stoltei]
MGHFKWLLDLSQMENLWCKLLFQLRLSFCFSIQLILYKCYCWLKRKPYFYLQSLLVSIYGNMTLWNNPWFPLDWLCKPCMWISWHSFRSQLY